MALDDANVSSPFNESCWLARLFSEFVPAALSLLLVQFLTGVWMDSVQKSVKITIANVTARGLRTSNVS